MDSAAIFSKHVANIRYEDIPANAVEITKNSILDTLAIIVGGSGAVPEVRKLVELVKEMGGKEESTIISFGGKVPACMAAFANGAMAHCLDYDEHHPTAKLHLCSSTVPAGFATAERVGRVSGKDFITAITLGNDLSARLGRAVTWKFPWQTTALLGIFSAAATSSKLLGLNEEQIIDALGLAFCQAAGSKEMSWGVGSNIRGMYPAFPAKGGVLSALMAQKGISGIKNSFEGKAGLFNLYFHAEYDRDILLTGLGKEFEGANTGFKPWPACGGTHVYIDATLEIVMEHDIHDQDIEEIRVVVGDLAKRLCEPLAARRRPMTTLDAKFSIPYSVAVAAARREVLISDYAPESLRNNTILALAERVVPEFDSEFNADRAMPPGLVKIVTRGGQTYSKRINLAYGHPQQPMTTEDLVKKFRDCVSYSVRPISKENIEKVIAMVGNLEDQQDVSKIITLLA